MAPIRKCTVCFRPVKGHPGPYGATKCKNGPSRTNDNNEEQVNQQGISHFKIKKGKESKLVLDVDSNQRQRSIVENFVNTIVEENDVEISQSLADAKKVNDIENRDFKIGYECVTPDQDVHFESVSVEHVQVPTISTNNEASKGETEEDGPGMPMEGYKMPNSSDEIKRLISQSDSNVDIRSLIIGKSFVLCFCKSVECVCESEVHFSKRLVGEAGSVENFFMNMGLISDCEIDLKPKLIFSKSGWKKETPNCIKFKVGGVISPTVDRSSGKVQLTATRVEEIVKGRKEFSTVIRGDFYITGATDRGMRGIGSSITIAVLLLQLRNPVKFQDIQCKLYEIREEEEDAVEKIAKEILWILARVNIYSFLT